MNMHTPEQLRQHSEHIARRERLWSGTPTAPVLLLEAALPEPEPEIMPAAKPKNRDMLKEALRRIDQLELDMADAKALMLSQEEKICALRHANETKAPPKPTVQEIVRGVLEEYPGVTWDDIKGVRRTKSLIEPRHRCIAAVFEHRKDFSVAAIARLFDRDRSVVLHALHKFAVRDSK